MRLPLLAVVALIAAQEPARVPIAWSLKKGESVRYEIEYIVASSVAAKVGTETSETKVVAGLVLEATEVAKDGTATVKAVFDRIAISTSGHGASEEYDSGREGDIPTSSNAKVMSKCVGKAFSLQLSPTGRVSAIEDLTKLVQGAVDSLPELKRKYKWKAEGVKRVARKLEHYLKAAFETPRGAPAAVGDSWETRLEDKDFTRGVGVAIRRARLKEIRSGEALIEESVTFEFPDAVAREIRESSGRGSLWWDTARGLLKSLNTTARIKSNRGEFTVTVNVLLAPAPAKKD